MAKKLGTVWPLEAHTAAKHAILRRYLQAWLPIMARYNDRIIYLDAFAGPGVYEYGEPGSPIIALQAAIEQSAFLKGEVIFLFVEEVRERLTNLNDEIKKLALPNNFLIAPRLGDCSATINKLLDYVDSKKASLAPTFAFLDPFGFSDTPMALVKRLMAHAKCEVLITFMFEEINRFLEHPEQPASFDALFGTAEWKNAAGQPTRPGRRAFLKTLYQRQLREAAGIRHVVAFEMRNAMNSLDYILFFGTNSVDGLKKMKEAMWKVDPERGFTFSDATDPDQQVVFTEEPNWDEVRRRMIGRFAGTPVPVEEIERFIVEETPFRETHFKRVLKEMESATPPTIQVALAKAGRHRGTYPGGTVVQFVGG